MHQHFAQQELNQETLSLHYFRDLKVELEQAEGAYQALVQQEAITFAQDLHQELNYHMTSNAQAQSLLFAERVLHDESLHNHTARWQQVLDMTTRGAEEEIEQERTNNIELANDLNDLRLELQEAEVQLKEWDDWYDSGVFTPGEEKEAGKQEETEAASNAATKPSLPPAPVTPAVLHNPVLSSRHLPPANSLVRFAEASSEKETDAEQEQQEARATAARALEEWGSQKEFELREALARISKLESSEARMGGVAPSLPPTMAYPIGGVSSQLTIGQPNPCIPGSVNKGPWAYTRERLQQTAALPPQPSQPLGGMTSSIGVPSVAAPSYGSASAAGAAYPAFASPSPYTPASALPQAQPFAQGFPQASPADDFSFKREKSALPKLQIKGGDTTNVTRVINEWLQKTALSLNTWSASAVQLWHHAVATARAAHQQWTHVAPSQRATFSTGGHYES